MPGDAPHARVILLAPTVRDGEASRSVLTAAGIACTVGADLAAVCREVALGGDVVLVPEESIVADAEGRLARELARQPVWSDLPVIVLARAGVESPAVALAMKTLGNVSVIERPVRVSTLLSVVRSALRARERQFQVRDYLRRQAESEASLRQARSEAEAANRAKDEFLAALSHELRTPLTPVLATLSAWEGDPILDPTLRQEVGMLRKNVELEARLIDDLLDLTRVAKGKLTLNPEVVDAHELIVEVASLYESDARATGTALAVRAGAARHHVWGDSARLHQVLSNLLRNAMKFTPAGGRIEIATDNLADGALRIVVTDTGIGMAPETVAKLFRPFEQGTEETLRRFGGLGLGLAISKAMVDAHGGTLSAASDGPGRGAAFTVTLATVAAPAVTAKAPRPQAMGDVPSRGLRILLVEDHKDTARAMRLLLTARGHAVTEVGSVADAVGAIGTGTFDLLLSDLGLPDGTGIDVIRHVRARSGVPAIALTGFGMEEDVARCIAAGFAAHLTKPVNVQRLEAVIREVAAG